MIDIVGVETWIDDYDYFLDDDIVAYDILSNNKLNKIADAMREEIGLLPLFPTEKHPEDFDPDGWYDFHAVIDKDGLREFYFTVTSSQEDDCKSYDIPLTEESKAYLLKRITEQSIMSFGRTPEGILDWND